MKRILKIFLPLVSALLILPSCTKEEEVRQPADILGVWALSEYSYFEFCKEYELRHLEVEYTGDGIALGIWSKDVYYYEPGYNLVIYLSGEKAADVYQIVTMTDEKLTWCPVDHVEITDADSAGKMIGEIIEKAQEGYKLDPALYQSFRKLSQEEFFRILEDLGIYYPWIY